MKAEIIAVGTEILTGQIVNTNAQFLSEKLASLGIDVYYHVAVGDNEGRLFSTIETASKRSDLVILCGGLGPTEDDLTKQTLAKFLGKELVFDPTALAKLDTFFASRPDYVRTPNNERQAQMIAGSIPLQNRTGLAVGGLIEVDGVTYVVLPGPPSELKPMVNEQLVPHLTTGEQLFSRVLRFFGIGESQLVTILADIIEKQSDPTVAPYAKTGELFYGYGDDNSMAKVAFDLLKRTGKTITAAESLTAGLFQATLADFSGASSIFAGGFVTYSLEEKSKMLSIPAQELEQHGVVSHFTAQAMASQARKLTGSDYGVSLTGVAGPDSLEGHPAGTVFIGLATPNGVDSVQVNIAGRSRADVREIAVLHAFNLVRLAVLNGENLV